MLFALALIVIFFYIIDKYEIDTDFGFLIRSFKDI